MLIVARYLGGFLLSRTLMICLALLGVEGLLHLLAELKDIGQGDYYVVQAILYVLFSLPVDIYELFPMAALLGTLLGLGQLSDHSELKVLRAAGISILQLMRYLLPAVAFMLVLVLILGEGIGPYAKNMAVRYKTRKLSQGMAVHTERGVWLKDHDNRMHIQSVISPQRLEGITYYELYRPRSDAQEAQQLHAIRFAPYALLKKGRWFFFHVAETMLHSDGHGLYVTSRTVPKQAWNIALNARVLPLAKVHPVQQSLWQLGASIAYRWQAGLPAMRYAFVFWQRVFQPVMILVMVLLGVVCTLGCLRQVSMSLRLLLGLMLGLIFYFLNQFVGSFTAVYVISPPLLAVLPAMFFALLAVFLAREGR